MRPDRPAERLSARPAGAAIWLALMALWPLAALTAPAFGDEIVLEPSQDTTLYRDDDGDLANGAGQFLFTGRGNDVKRTMLAFDLSAIPAGSIVEEAELTLNLSRTIVGGVSHQLRRVERAWGEGASDAPGQEGAGGPSEPGDATWIHTFFDSELWSSPGGDVAGDASATLLVGDDNGPQVFASTPALVADVQGWVDDPASNFGWQVRGSESFLMMSAKRFDSREHPDPDRRPRLRVVFTPPPGFEIPTVGAAGLLVLAALLAAAGVVSVRRR